MRYKMIFTLIVVSATVFSLVSCSTDTAMKNEKKIEIFPEIENYSVKIEPVSPRREFYAGEKVVMRFKLTNTGHNLLLVPEWMAKSSDNFNIYSHPYQKKMRKFIAADWKKESPEISKPVKRKYLSLSPNNSIFINKRIEFISDVDSRSIPEDGKKYFVLIELNLATVKAKSKAFVIKVK